MNVTVFATVGEVAVFIAVLLTPVSGIIVIFLQGENRLTLMWFHHHQTWSLLCVWFPSNVYMEMLLPPPPPPAQIAVIGSWTKKIVVKITVWSADCWKYRKVFCLFFVFYAHSHCSVSPQVWLWLCSRSVRFTRNKQFFSCKLTFLCLLAFTQTICLDISKRLVSFVLFKVALYRFYTLNQTLPSKACFTNWSCGVNKM